MSSFLCFICHSTVNDDTNEETRERYREVVGMNLCPDSHLCHICCHVLNRLWLFRSVCLKRSLEYPVLFSEKGTLNLQRNDLEFNTVCIEDTCEHYKSRNLNSKFYHFTHLDKQFDNNDKENETNKYVELYEDRDFDDFLPIPHIDNIIPDINYENNVETNFNNTENNDQTHNEGNSDDGYEDLDDIEEETIDIQYNDLPVDLNESSDQIQTEVKCKKRKSKSNRIKKKFERIMLSLEEQKAELEGNRRSKKYIEAEFKCSNCSLGFLFKDTYQAHMMRHEESNGEHRCDICTLRFANPAVLRAHKGLHGERYRCLNCNLMIRKRQRTEHAKDCFGIKVDQASCHLCGRVFKDSAGLQQHLKRFHRGGSTRGQACSVCGQRCADPAALRTHMIKHIQKKFPCEVCPSVFSSPYTLKQHSYKHTARAHETCDLCGVTYSCRKSLRAHVRNVHVRDRDVKRPPKRAPRPRPPRPGPPAVCHLCGAVFKGNSKLNRHLREVCEKNRLEEELSAFYTHDVGV